MVSPITIIINHEVVHAGYCNSDSESRHCAACDAGANGSLYLAMPFLERQHLAERRLIVVPIAIIHRAEPGSVGEGLLATRYGCCRSGEG
jgi:hypothetical protein